MPIPDYQSMMLPTLEIVSDGQVHTNIEALDILARRFEVTEDERRILSGKIPYFNHNFSWTKTYLKKAQLIAYTGRSQFRITERGRQILSTHPARIDVEFLSGLPDFREWTDEWNTETESNISISQQSQVTDRGGQAVQAPSGSPGLTTETQSHISEIRTPEEVLNFNVRIINQVLADDILEKVRSCSPRFFERLVVELLVRMGYGGSMADAGQVVGRSGDGGIDGIIKRDILGLDTVYLQAKRWNSVVGIEVVRSFSASVHDRRGRYGVIISTSWFSLDAREFANRSGDPKVILIDGRELANAMIEHNLGVSPERAITIKRVDSDYFEEE